MWGGALVEVTVRHQTLLLVLACGCGSMSVFEAGKDAPADTALPIADTGDPATGSEPGDSTEPSQTTEPTDPGGTDPSSGSTGQTPPGTGPTDTGTPPGGTTPGAPAPVVLDGVYVGTIVIDYTLLVPFFGGSSVCDGPITLTVDQAAVPAVTGTIECEWPVLDLWAQVWLNTAYGALDGNIDPSGTLLSGDTQGSESVGTFTWDEPWEATVLAGPVIEGAFDGKNPLYDTYSATFTATWVSP